VTHPPVRGRRIAAVGLTLSALVVLAALVYLGFWWFTGAPPFPTPHVPAAPAGAP
jgi:hypothetical protein